MYCLGIALLSSPFINHEVCAPEPNTGDFEGVWVFRHPAGQIVPRDDVQPPDRRPTLGRGLDEVFSGAKRWQLNALVRGGWSLERHLILVGGANDTQFGRAAESVEPNIGLMTFEPQGLTRHPQTALKDDVHSCHRAEGLHQVYAAGLRENP